jgi:hypothetical protein
VLTGGVNISSADEPRSVSPNVAPAIAADLSKSRREIFERCLFISVLQGVFGVRRPQTALIFYGLMAALWMDHHTGINQQAKRRRKYDSRVTTVGGALQNSQDVSLHVDKQIQSAAGNTTAE